MDAPGSDIASVHAKVALTWFGVTLAKLGIYQWSDAAAVVATFYTLLLIGEWVWKRAGRGWWTALKEWWDVRGRP